MREALASILLFVVAPLCGAGFFLFFAFNRAARRLYVTRPYFRMVRRSKPLDRIEQAFSLVLGLFLLCLPFFIVMVWLIK